MTITLNSQVDCLSPFCSVLKFCLILSFEAYSSVSFCFTFGVCFYELDKTATSPCLKGVILCRNVPSVDCMYLVALGGASSGGMAEAGTGWGDLGVPMP